jgi:hypothetical protein
MRVFGLWCRRQWSGRLGRQPEPDSRTAFVPIHLPVLPIETTQVLLFAPGADGGGGGLGFLPAEHRACRHQSSDFFPGTSDHDFFTLLNQVGSTRWAQPGRLNQVEQVPKFVLRLERAYLVHTCTSRAGTGWLTHTAPACPSASGSHRMRSDCRRRHPGRINGLARAS